ncbi:hypothetical protein [Pseudomonas typographi]|uniref:Uncharacterized protein n=1 Tax=Pseudomonas typographi TaxID=2715964 RepID=A0ABR7Z634_9PSED|nr:hypothetical protein [Pseudomonas typographi]MBD1600971.1 hypothetical protein [Pseudomonas typographi]
MPHIPNSFGSYAAPSGTAGILASVLNFVSRLKKMCSSSETLASVAPASQRVDMWADVVLGGSLHPRLNVHLFQQLRDEDRLAQYLPEMQAYLQAQGLEQWYAGLAPVDLEHWLMGRDRAPLETPAGFLHHLAAYMHGEVLLHGETVPASLNGQGIDRLRLQALRDELKGALDGHIASQQQSERGQLLARASQTLLRQDWAVHLPAKLLQNLLQKLSPLALPGAAGYTALRSLLTGQLGIGAAKQAWGNLLPELEKAPGPNQFLGVLNSALERGVLSPLGLAYGLATLACGAATAPYTVPGTLLLGAGATALREALAAWLDGAIEPPVAEPAQVVAQLGRLAGNGQALTGYVRQSYDCLNALLGAQGDPQPLNRQRRIEDEANSLAQFVEHCQVELASLRYDLHGSQAESPRAEQLRQVLQVASAMHAHAEKGEVGLFNAQLEQLLGYREALGVRAPEGEPAATSAGPAGPATGWGGRITQAIATLVMAIMHRAAAPGRPDPATAPLNGPEAPPAVVVKPFLHAMVAGAAIVGNNPGRSLRAGVVAATLTSPWWGPLVEKLARRAADSSPLDTPLKRELERSVQILADGTQVQTLDAIAEAVQHASQTGASLEALREQVKAILAGSVMLGDGEPWAIGNPDGPPNQGVVRALRHRRSIAEGPQIVADEHHQFGDHSVHIIEADEVILLARSHLEDPETAERQYIEDALLQQDFVEPWVRTLPITVQRTWLRYELNRQARLLAFEQADPGPLPEPVAAVGQALQANGWSLSDLGPVEVTLNHTFTIGGQELQQQRTVSLVQAYQDVAAGGKCTVEAVRNNGQEVSEVERAAVDDLLRSAQARGPASPPWIEQRHEALKPLLSAAALEEDLLQALMRAKATNALSGSGYSWVLNGLIGHGGTQVGLLAIRLRNGEVAELPNWLLFSRVGAEATRLVLYRPGPPSLGGAGVFTEYTGWPGLRQALNADVLNENSPSPMGFADQLLQVSPSSLQAMAAEVIDDIKQARTEGHTVVFDPLPGHMPSARLQAWSRLRQGQALRLANEQIGQARAAASRLDEEVAAQKSREFADAHVISLEAFTRRRERAYLVDGLREMGIAVEPTDIDPDEIQLTFNGYTFSWTRWIINGYRQVGEPAWQVNQDFVQSASFASSNTKVAELLNAPQVKEGLQERLRRTYTGTAYIAELKKLQDRQNPQAAEYAKLFIQAQAAAMRLALEQEQAAGALGDDAVWLGELLQALPTSIPAERGVAHWKLGAFTIPGVLILSSAETDNAQRYIYLPRGIYGHQLFEYKQFMAWLGSSWSLREHLVDLAHPWQASALRDELVKVRESSYAPVLAPLSEPADAAKHYLGALIAHACAETVGRGEMIAGLIKDALSYAAAGACVAGTGGVGSVFCMGMTAALAAQDAYSAVGQWKQGDRLGALRQLAWTSVDLVEGALGLRAVNPRRFLAWAGHKGVVGVEDAQAALQRTAKYLEGFDSRTGKLNGRWATPALAHEPKHQVIPDVVGHFYSYNGATLIKSRGRFYRVEVDGAQVRVRMPDGQPPGAPVAWNGKGWRLGLASDVTPRPPLELICPTRQRRALTKLDSCASTPEALGISGTAEPSSELVWVKPGPSSKGDNRYIKHNGLYFEVEPTVQNGVWNIAKRGGGAEYVKWDGGSKSWAVTRIPKTTDTAGRRFYDLRQVAGWQNAHQLKPRDIPDTLYVYTTSSKAAQVRNSAALIYSRRVPGGAEVNKDIGVFATHLSPTENTPREIMNAIFGRPANDLASVRDVIALDMKKLQTINQGQLQVWANTGTGAKRHWLIRRTDGQDPKVVKPSPNPREQVIAMVIESDWAAKLQNPRVPGGTPQKRPSQTGRGQAKVPRRDD